jgi:hypothetical protein
MADFKTRLQRAIEECEFLGTYGDASGLLNSAKEAIEKVHNSGSIFSKESSLERAEFYLSKAREDWYKGR